MSTPIDPTSPANQTPPVQPAPRAASEPTPEERAQEARLRREQSAPRPEPRPEQPPPEPSRGGGVDQVV